MSAPDQLAARDVSSPAGWCACSRRSGENAGGPLAPWRNSSGQASPDRAVVELHHLRWVGMTGQPKPPHPPAVVQGASGDGQVVVDPTLLDGYVGTYQLGDFTMVMAREGDRLVVQVRDQRIPLSAETDRDFFLKGTDTHIIFVADSNGRTTEVLLREGGSDVYAHRRE